MRRQGQIKDIRKVLDSSVEIQLDKTIERANYAARAEDEVNGYYKDEMAEAKKNVKKRLEAEGKTDLPADEFNKLKVKEAERLFAEKQRQLMIEGGVRACRVTT
jgi:hypothetical protein